MRFACLPAFHPVPVWCLVLLLQHIASAAGFAKVCTVLVEAGASRSIKTADGVLASSLAATHATSIALEA